MTKAKLHPGARWIFRVGGLLKFLPILIFSFIFLVMGSASYMLKYALAGFTLWLIPLFFLIILIEIYARMSYNRWFYEFTNSNLKLERGIIWKKYSNIPYERVQNVDIQRGILARIFGFSSVNIQTAGYSAPYSQGWGNKLATEGYIPAVSIEDAEKIREFLMNKINSK